MVICLVIVGLIGGGIWLCGFRSFWLTQTYESEMKAAILRYQTVVGSQSVCLDPTLLSEIATGAALVRQQTTINNSINSGKCSVFEQTGVRSVRVFEYSSTCARVSAESWHLRSYQIDLDTLEVITGTEQISVMPRPGTHTYILLRENSDADWKVAYQVFHSHRTQWYDIPTCRNVPPTYD